MSTFRQKLTASKLVENGGNIGKAMRAAGYSASTAKTPKKLTQSKGWEELMGDFFPDELLVKVHKSLLNDKNWRARNAALDKAYKLKGRYAPEKVVDEGYRRQIDELSDQIKNWIGAP